MNTNKRFCQCVSRADITKFVAECLRQQNLREAASLDELGIDEYDLMEVILMAEKEFDIEIDDKKIERIETIANLVTILETEIKRR